eukprot:jgi/Astpho2/3383/e_gw1.00054.24.1_t
MWRSGDVHCDQVRSCTCCVQAAKVGRQAAIPLALPKGDLSPLDDQLSSGGQSTVYRAAWRGQQVAVKKAKITTAQDLSNLKLELLMMAEMHHSGVLPLLAAHVLPPDYLMVFPLMQQNLAEAIHTQGWRPGWPEVLSLGCLLAAALAAVHAAGILHRDVKPGNLLRGRDGSVRLCDFGIAVYADELGAEQGDRGSLVGRGKPSGGFYKRHMVGTLEYLAPEVLQKERVGYPSDIWALGVTLNELATGTFPYSDCTRDNPAAHTVLEMGYGRQELSAAIAAEGLQPLMRPDTPADLRELLESCWRLDPSKRPSAAQLEQRLQAMQARGTLQPGTQCSKNLHLLGPAPKLHPHSLLLEAACVSGLCVLCSTGHSSNQVRTRWWPVAAPAPLQRPEVTVGSFATAGRRGEDRMEDRHAIKAQFGGHPDAHLLAVFDGHRGSEAAAFAAREVQRSLERRWQSRTANDLLQRCFLDLDADFRQRTSRMGSDAAGERRWPGCCALALLVWQDLLLIANAGGEGQSIKALQLTADHSAASPSERARVEAAGARVDWRVNSWRVGPAGLQVTRSIGDADVKAQGVTALPEVAVHQLAQHDEFVVLASDGLWEKVSNEDMVTLIQDTVKQPDMAAKRLATEAMTRGSNDNITVIVAFLKPVSTLENVYNQGKRHSRWQ